MKIEFRQYLVYSLYSTLDWMIQSEDWFKRSELVTRASSIIYQLGSNTESIFDMDAEYLVTDRNKLRIYRNKLNDAIDLEDRKERENAIFEFFVWLHEIRLLKEDE